MIAYTIGATVILGLVGAFLAFSAGLRHHYRKQRGLAEQAYYEDVLQRLDGDPPPSWDPCIVRDPRTPQRGDSHDNT